MTDINDGNDIDDLLDGADHNEPVSELETAAQPEQAEQAEPTEEPGEKTAVPPADYYDDSGPMVPRKALEDERRKRQDYERQVKEYSAWMQGQQQQRQQPQEQPEAFQPPDPWTDPEGALQYQQHQLQTQFQAQIVATRVETSRQLMRMQHPDYNDMEKVFDEVCQTQPELLQHAAQHPMPAQFAYEIAKRHLVWQRYEANPAAFEAAYSGQVQQPSPAAPTSEPTARIPVSLAQRTSNAPRNRQGQFIEHASIDDILDG